MVRVKRFGKRKFHGNQHINKDTSACSSSNLILPNVARPIPTPRPTSPEMKSRPSSSKEKLKYLNSVGTKMDYVKERMEEGNIIVDLGILSKEIRNFVSCRNCTAKDSISIFEVTGERRGIASKLVISCNNCSYETSFMTSKKTESKHFENNLRFVYGLRSIGKGEASGSTFCSVMNLPQPPAKFSRYNEVIYKSLYKVAQESMVNAARDAVVDNDGCNEISVALDGTWQKRGHTSNNGVVTVTSLSNGKVLDVECLSKFCPLCKIKNKKEHHDCSANYQGPSGGMEAAGVLKLFERSEQNVIPVRYVNFLGDGDSKAYDVVVRSKPYGEDVHISKLECVGHIQKRMGTRLRRLRKDYSKRQLSDGKYLSGRGRLTDDTIDKLQQYYGNAIRSSKTLESMQQAVWATYFHKLSTNSDPQHGMCPIDSDSWCKYNRAAARGLPCPDHDNSLPVAVMDTIKPVYKALCEPRLLKRCLHGRTQNCNEAFNNIIWTRLPKTTFVNHQTLKVGVMDAVLCFNDGVLGKVRVLEDMCGSAGGNTVLGLKVQDNKRVYEAERAMMELEKRARQARRNVKRRLEDVELEEDDPCYGAGMF